MPPRAADPGVGACRADHPLGRGSGVADPAADAALYRFYADMFDAHGLHWPDRLLEGLVLDPDDASPIELPPQVDDPSEVAVVLTSEYRCGRTNACKPVLPPREPTSRNCSWPRPLSAPQTRNHRHPTARWRCSRSTGWGTGLLLGRTVWLFAHRFGEERDGCLTLLIVPEQFPDQVRSLFGL